MGRTGMNAVPADLLRFVSKNGLEYGEFSLEDRSREGLTLPSGAIHLPAQLADCMATIQALKLGSLSPLRRR